MNKINEVVKIRLLCIKLQFNRRLVVNFAI
jgi:hypothetical protein